MIFVPHSEEEAAAAARWGAKMAPSQFREVNWRSAATKINPGTAKSRAECDRFGTTKAAAELTEGAKSNWGLFEIECSIAYFRKISAHHPTINLAINACFFDPTLYCLAEGLPPLRANTVGTLAFGSV